MVLLGLGVLGMSGCKGDLPGRSSKPALPQVSHARSGAGQCVEELLSTVTVGGTVPAAPLRERLSAAVTEAGSWRAEYEDVQRFVVTTVLDQQGQPAMRIQRPDDGGPGSDVRLVGDEVFWLEPQHPGGPRWLVGSRRDDGDPFRVTDQEVEDMLRTASALVVVEAVASTEATVVARSGRATTVTLQLDHQRFAEVVGDASGAEGPVTSTWVVEDGLPVSVRVEEADLPQLEFSEWGTAGPVDRPPSAQLESRRDHLLEEPHSLHW